MKPDPHGCRADWEHEQDCEGRRRLHELEECDGPGHCDYCDEESGGGDSSSHGSGKRGCIGGRKEGRTMKIGEAFPGKYIKAADLQGRRVNAVIDSVEMVNIGDDGDKLVVYFKGKEKGLICNVTNARMIEEIAHSDETDEWNSIEICLYPTKVEFSGRRVDAIRVDYPGGQAQPRGGARNGNTAQAAKPPVTILPTLPAEDRTDSVPPPTDDDDIPF